MTSLSENANQASSSPPAAEQVAAQALALAAQGKNDESLRAWEAVLGLDAGHPDALYHLGHRLLRGGRAEDARAFFEKALRRAQGAPLVHLALAQTANALGKMDEEQAQLDRVLSLDPYSVSALLAKGAIFERQGKLRTAGDVYRNALKAISPGAAIPPQLRSILQRALRLVDEQRQALNDYLSEAVHELRAKSAPEDLQRYDQCQAIFTGLKTGYVQQPLLLNFPGLPAIQFYDRHLFPWLESFESHTSAIRDELQNVMQAERLTWTPYINHPDGAPLNQWKDLQRSDRWSSYFLWKDGRPLDEALAKFPATAAALKDMPLNVVPGRGPTVFFSSLAPKTHIPPHTGSTNARLVVHLPLIVPSGCALRVGNDTREFVEGSAWVFDDTIEHEAWNNSEFERIVLLIDIWNPFLTQTERDLVGALLAANERYYKEET